MEDKQMYYKVMNDVNDLFCKIFAYNTKLLKLCNDKEYTPTFEEIFDFYITSNAMAFLKNFYCDYIEAPGILLNGRCILEGLALKVAYENNKIDEFNIELLKRQDALIEYKQYKKFKEIMETVSIPEETKRKYDEAVKFYRETLVSYSKEEFESVINSQIPFLCNPKINYRQLIEENLGKETAEYYSMLSVYIHPRSNELIDTKTHTFILLDIFTTIQNVFKDLPNGSMDLRTMIGGIYYNKEAEKFNDTIKAECTQMELIQADFNKNFGNNYVSDTFHMISMLIQEMMFDTLFGLSEQVKSKWKVMVELLAGFYEIYLVQDDVDNSYRLLQYHEDVSIYRAIGNDKELDDTLNKAYDYYLKKYPNGVSFEQFSHKYISTAGFTIDENGKVKTLTQLVNQLCNLFDGEPNTIQIKDVLKLNYVESQMLSHANGYLWYANSGAWGDTVNVYININHLIILDKVLNEEEQIPSTTHLSKEYNINVATVNKAINVLVDEGLVYKKRGIGMFVKEGALNTLIEERRKVFKERYIKASLIEAKKLNYTIDDLQTIVKEAFDEMDK